MYKYENIILKLLETKNITVKQSGKEVRCCCPFHEEKSPSFSINLETGKYICFSGSCGVKGNIISFISHLTKRDYKDVEKDFQINIENLKYDNIINNTLSLFENKEEQKKVIKYNNYQFIELNNLQDEQKILNLINIPKKISDLVGLKVCLTNPYKKRLVVPIDKNIYEFRALLKNTGKKCLYEKGVKIGDYLFKVIVNKEDNSIFLTEGTKDAMSVAGFGYNACCTFGINISDNQIANILKLGINKVYIMRDNDEAGQKSSYNTFDILKNYIDCQILKYPKDFKFKDPNEIKDKRDFLKILEYNL